MDASAQQVQAKRPVGAAGAGRYGHPFRPVRVTVPAGAGARQVFGAYVRPAFGCAVSAVVTPVPVREPLSALTVGGI